MDDFVFELSQEEFMDYFFEDLALPDLVKKQLAAVPEVKRVRAGFVSQGNPSNLHVVRSMKQAIGRRMAMAAGPRDALREAEEALEALVAQGRRRQPRGRRAARGDRSAQGAHRRRALHRHLRPALRQPRRPAARRAARR